MTTKADRKWRAAQRRTQATQLKASGLTQAEIGTKLGVSAQRVSAILKESRDKSANDPAEIRRLDLNHLEEMLIRPLKAAKLGNLEAIDAVLRIMERRDKLLSQDAYNHLPLVPASATNRKEAANEAS